MLVDMWSRVRTAANTHIQAKDPPVQADREGRESTEEGGGGGKVLPHSYTRVRESLALGAAHLGENGRLVHVATLPGILLQVDYCALLPHYSSSLQ